MQRIKKINDSFFNKSIIIFLYSFLTFIFIFKPAHTSSVLDIKEDDFVLGNKNAPVTIIEYASLSCSHCASFHKNTMPKLFDEYIDTGKVKLVFRDFPLNFPALMGSMLLQCVDQDIRYEYLTALFVLQSAWVKPEVEIVQKELFKIMQVGGMKKDKFDQCLNNKDLEEKILKDLISAQKEFSINTTPSFLINGTMLPGNKSFKDFKKIIDKILISIE